MARIKLLLPEKFIFSTQLNIRIGDINYRGHLGNDAVLTLVHEARVKFLTHFGYTEMNIEGCSLIMTDAAIEFISEAFYGNSVTIEMAIQDISRIGFDIFYLLKNESLGKNLALVKTGMVFYDYEKRKITSTPSQFSENFSAN